MKKTRIELECECTLCPMKFIIWNIGELIGKEVGSGVRISGLICPNCHSELKFDLVRGVIHN